MVLHNLLAPTTGVGCNVTVPLRGGPEGNGKWKSSQLAEHRVGHFIVYLVWKRDNQNNESALLYGKLIVVLFYG